MLKPATPHLSTMSDAGHVSCLKHFLCPDILLPVGVLLSYLVLLYQDTHCYMLHEQQQTISMRSNVQELTHVLLMNTPCSHLYSFCASGLSSDLATRVTLTRVSRGRLGESITRGWTCFWFHFCTIVRDCFWGCVLNGTLCRIASILKMETTKCPPYSHRCESLKSYTNENVCDINMIVL
jgi:hypothetical protein